MDQDQVMPTLTELFRDVFNDPALAISSATRAQDIDGWDSLTNITLMVAAEQQFGIRFRAAELDGLRDVGALAALIAAKRAA
jgi:acyl carrier protein